MLRALRQLRWQQPKQPLWQLPLVVQLEDEGTCLSSEAIAKLNDCHPLTVDYVPSCVEEYIPFCVQADDSLALWQQAH